MYTFIAVPNPQNSELPIISTLLREVAEVALVPVPQFKIGTLDTLIVTADELAKFDGLIEQSTGKIVDNLRQLLDGKEDQLKSSLLVNDKTVDAYLKSFSWNAIKYRMDKSIDQIAEALHQEVSSVDQLLKTKLNTYTATKNSLVALERKQTGSLGVKSLVDVVRKEHVIMDSEYLKSVIVAVPNAVVKEFTDSYERLAQFVVPRSALKIAVDNEYNLYSVVCFQKTHDEFIGKLRELKCIPRDFQFSDQAVKQEKKEYNDLGASVKEQWTVLLRLCRSNFGEVFGAWIHIKVLRVFVESILRYGLPPNFLCTAIRSKPKQERKVVDLLSKTYSRLASGAAKDSKESSKQEEGIPEHFLDKDYRPYVSFDLKLAWEDSKKD